MLALYRTSGDIRVPPKACRPEWVQMLSDSCAPVAPCSEFHAWLATKRGLNQLYLISRNSLPKLWWPKFGSMLVKSSQWATLWLQDALEIARDEKAVERRWAPHLIRKGRIAWFYKSLDVHNKSHLAQRSAPDEIVLPTELAYRGKKSMDDPENVCPYGAL